MTPAPAGAAPYVHHAAYWVIADDAAIYPVRQGDLFADVQVGGDRWDAALLVHPTCELGKASVAEVQVVRVRPLENIADEAQRRRVVAGVAEMGGMLRVAFAHTFFVAPVPGSRLGDPMWANLRETGLAAREQFTTTERVGALTHEARVTFVRRYLYFRFRLALSFEQVPELESARIRADPTFLGPRPSWAS